MNVVLVLCTRHLIPNTESLPLFEPRKHINLDSPEAYGITPFVIAVPEPRLDDVIVLGEEKILPPIPENPSAAGTPEPSMLAIAQWASVEQRPRSILRRSDSTASDSTISSVDSETPMLRNVHRGAFLIGHR